MDNPKQEMIDKVRAAVQDRATWFYLLYKSFKEVLPQDVVEKQTRKAIFEFGLLKAKKDDTESMPESWVKKHVSKGSALIFDSDIEIEEEFVVQRMKHCALVDAWKALGCDDEELALLCDMAMEGDRGRAEGHGVRMELEETIAKGDSFCNLKIFKRGL